VKVEVREAVVGLQCPGQLCRSISPDAVLCRRAKRERRRREEGGRRGEGVERGGAEILGGAWMAGEEGGARGEGWEIKCG
jgi:hypothetical protein